MEIVRTVSPNDLPNSQLSCNWMGIAGAPSWWLLLGLCSNKSISDFKAITTEK